MDLMERSVNLLRRAGLEALGLWLLGTVPFVLTVIYQWTFWTTHPNASRALLQGSLQLTITYCWMKTLQSLLGDYLLASAGRVSWTYPGLRATMRKAFVQIRVQATALLVLPLALLLAFPFGWAFAFYHAFTLTGNFGQSARIARLRPRANHILISYFSLLALLVYGNVLVSMFFLPSLLRTITGMESIMLRNPSASMNGTVFLAAAGFSFLLLGLMVRSVYALWIFDAQSRHSGADILMDLADLRMEAGR